MILWEKKVGGKRKREKEKLRHRSLRQMKGKCENGRRKESGSPQENKAPFGDLLGLLLVGGIGHLAKFVLFGEFAGKLTKLLNQLVAYLDDSRTGGDLAISLHAQLHVGGQRVGNLRRSQCHWSIFIKGITINILGKRKRWHFHACGGERKGDCRGCGPPCGRWKCWRMACLVTTRQKTVPWCLHGCRINNLRVSTSTSILLSPGPSRIDSYLEFRISQWIMKWESKAHDGCRRRERKTGNMICVIHG